MDKFLNGLKTSCFVVLIVVYTLIFYAMGFAGGWYKGVADTLKPMFFEQANATGNVNPPSSPVQFPKNPKQPPDENGN